MNERLKQRRKEVLREAAEILIAEVVRTEIARVTEGAVGATLFSPDDLETLEDHIRKTLETMTKRDLIAKATSLAEQEIVRLVLEMMKEKRDKGAEA